MDASAAFRRDDGCGPESGYARLGTYMSNGEFVVGTAETVLAADITVRCEKIVCGPYARYAQKFLGLRAPLTDKTVYTVADAAIA